MIERQIMIVNQPGNKENESINQKTELKNSSRGVEDKDK